MSCTIIVLGSQANSLIGFRYKLLEAFVKNGNKVYACAPDASDAVISKLLNIGVKYQNIPISRTGLNPLQDLKNLIKTIKIFKSLSADMILNYTMKPVIYGSIAAKLAGIKNIYSMITGLGYSFTSKGFKPKLISIIVTMLLRVSLSFNKLVIFQNPDDELYFKEHKILTTDKKTVIINGSGVDLDYFQYTQPNETISFLLIARLIKDKGIVEYVEAAEIVKITYPNIVFSIAGWIDSNPAAIEQQQLDKWLEKGIIHFLGKLDDVREALKNCSVFVLPSYREGTPRSTLEAMSVGRCIITTDVPGCRETVQNNVNGLLVPHKNKEKLAGAIMKLIENPELIVEMGKASRQLAEKKYDVYKVNQDILNAMELKANH